MATAAHILAIETSTRQGSITLGLADQALESVELPEPKRHRLALMMAIDELFQRHGLAPANLGEVYVSIGPGSFTGLRIAVTTAKMLAMTLGVRLVAVPTVEVLAENVPPRAVGAQLAVCLNTKADTAYTGCFVSDGERWQLNGPPRLMAMDQLLAQLPRPVLLLGEALAESIIGDRVERLPSGLAEPRSEHVFTIGRAMARRGLFTTGYDLLPLYARRPEAEEVWERNQKRRKVGPTATAGHR